MNIVNHKWPGLKRLRAIAALGGACFVLSASVLPTAYAQELVINEAKSGTEKLLTLRFKVNDLEESGVGGFAPEFPEAFGKVYEFNVSATCTFSNSDTHTLTVRFKDVSSLNDSYVKSANGGNSVSIMTGPVVGFNGQGTPAFSVECTGPGATTSIEVIALGRIIDTASELDDHSRIHKKFKNGKWD